MTNQGLFFQLSNNIFLKKMLANAALRFIAKFLRRSVYKCACV